MNCQILKINFLSIVAIGIFSLLIPLPTLASHVPNAKIGNAVESIKSYDVKIQITTDGGVKVVEDILYDFSTNDKHGIIRNIPTHYYSADDDYLRLPYELKGVSNGESERPYVDGNDGVKIGANLIGVTGLQRYVISYDVDHVIQRYEDIDELFWDVIGTEWEVPIRAASVSVTLPSGSVGDVVCFTGKLDSTESDCSVSSSGAFAGATLDRSLNSELINDINSREGFSIAVGFDQNIVVPSGRIYVDNTNGFFTYLYLDNSDEDIEFSMPVRPGVYNGEIRSLNEWHLPIYREVVVKSGESTVIPVTFKYSDEYFILNYGLSAIVAIIYIFLIWFAWRKFGKDDPGRSVIVAQYEPPKNVGPAMAGLVVDGKTHSRDVFALIIWLATKGFLKIVRIDPKTSAKAIKYELIKIKKDVSTLSKSQQMVFTAIFKKQKINSKINLETGVLNVWNKWSKIVILLHEEAWDSGYYHVRPWRGMFLGILLSFILVIPTILVGAFSIDANLPVLGLVVVFCWVVFAATSFTFGRRTEKGSLVREHILGLEEYLNVVEKDRFAFSQTPKQFREVFEMLLPYAIALKLEKTWIYLFKKYKISNRSYKWIRDSSGPISVSKMMLSIRGASALSAKTISRSRSSGGGSRSGYSGSSGSRGGSSGGGFGGGGGRSW